MSAPRGYEGLAHYTEHSIFSGKPYQCLVSNFTLLAVLYRMVLYPIGGTL